MRRFCCRRREHSGQRFGFCLQPGESAFGRARPIDGCCFPLLSGQGCFRCRHDAGAVRVDPRGSIRYCGGGFRQSGSCDHCGEQWFAFAFAVGEAGLQPAMAFGKIAALAVEGGAAGLTGRAGLGHLLQTGLSGGERCRRNVELRRSLGPRPLGGGNTQFQPAPLIGKPGERGIRVGKMAGLAADIGLDLLHPALRLATSGDNAGQLLFERLAGMTEALHRCRCLGLRHAQIRHRRFGFGAKPFLYERRFGRGGDRALGVAQFGGDAFAFGCGRVPARREQQRFCLPNLFAEPAIALRLPRLFPQHLDLYCEGRDHIVDPGQIRLGSLQSQLGFVAPGMQPGGAGRLVEQQAAFGGFGGDQRGDPALAD